MAVIFSAVYFSKCRRINFYPVSQVKRLKEGKNIGEYLWERKKSRYLWEGSEDEGL